MTTSLPSGQQDLLLALFKGKCAYCPAPWEVWDHIEPWAEWGETRFNNIVPACKKCNYSKGSNHFEEWAAATGRHVKAAVYNVRAVGDYNCELSLVGGKLVIKKVGTSPILKWILKKKPIPSYVSPSTLLRLQKANWKGARPL